MSGTSKPKPKEVQLTVRLTPDGIREAFENLAKLQQSLGAKQARAAAKRRPPIEEVLEQLGAQVPDEVWNQLPDDFNEQLDHYIYGLPKR